MSTIKVQNSAGLLNALKSAKSGDVISLASGNYSDFYIKNINVTGGVTIQSADDKHPAKISNLTVQNSSGLTFKNLEVVVDPAGNNYAVTLANTSAIAFDKINAHGTLDANPGNDKSFLMINASQNVIVTNSEIQQVRYGITFSDSRDVVIRNNDIHDIRTDGINGAGTSNLAISGNYLHDFYAVGGDHPDAIQLWTKGTTDSASNIAITDNVIVRGNGTAMQGIFFRDQVGGLPFQNVTITGNSVIGAMTNGIAIASVKGLKLEDNTVLGMADQRSTIYVNTATNSSVKNNVTTELQVTDNASLSRASNVLVQAFDGAAVGEVGRYLDAYQGQLTKLSGALKDTVKSTIKVMGAIDGTATEKAAAENVYKPAEQLVMGTAGTDKLYAGKIGDYRLLGGLGDDTLTGGSSGHTYLVGGAGADNYIVRHADDYVVELNNEGYDTVSAYIDYRLGDNVEVLRMMASGTTGRGNELGNRIIGSDGSDTIYAEGGNDQVQAGAGNDRIWGGTGDDELRGDEGDDLIYGNEGIDSLLGGAGNDTLDGGAGADLLQGGAGADRLIGGDGADVFIYRPGDFTGGVAANLDTILDFSSKQGDKINLQPIDAKSATAADDKFAFIGTGDFTKVAGQLRYKVEGGDSYVSGDVNGDGLADFTIKMIGVTTFTAGDFIL